MMNSLPVDLSQVRSQTSTKQSYTDLNSLQQIKVTGKEDKDLALRQVAQQFESMFVDMMLKSMRSANEVFGQDNPLNTSEMKHHQEMYDKQLSLSLSEGSRIGLAEAFYRQMKQSYSPGVSKEYLSENPNDIAKNNFETNNRPVIHSNEAVYPTSRRPQRIEDAAVLKAVENPQDYIDAITPYAQKAAKALGVDYRVLVAQSALETGWGEHVIHDKQGNQSFNLFNIKADSRWEGKSVAVPTIEYVDGVAQREKAHFRRYASIDESFNDYQQFLSQSRYQKALAASDDANRFVQELQNAGYATDPKYAEKIQSILKNERLWARN
jgi:flagellar protein FlgJ